MNTETKERLKELRTAAKQVVQDWNLRHVTLGPCDYCGWWQTRSVRGSFTTGESKHICALCDKFTDTIFCRQFWVDYPANVI